MAQPLPVRHSGDARFATLEHEYVTYVLAQFPVVATYLGGAAFDPTLAAVDGKLRDYSPAALQQEDARLGEFRARFAALAPATLSARRRIDRSVALAQIDFLVHEHTVRRHQLRSLDSYVDEPFRGVDWQIQAMSATGAATYGTDAEWREVIARARAIALILPPPKTSSPRVSRRTTRLTGGCSTISACRERCGRRVLHQDPAADRGTDIAPAHREALVRDLQAAGNPAASAYRHLRDFVITTFFTDPQLEGSAALKPAYRSDRFAFGAVEYDWALRNNLHVEPDGRRALAGSWGAVQATRAEMMTLARQIAASHHWPAAPSGERAVRAVFEQLSQNAPRTDAEMVEGYRHTGQRLVEYARTTGLFDMPADYRLEVTATPPPLRSSIEGAAYYAAPPFKKGGIGRFYVTPTDDDAAELRAEHNYAAMPDLAAHEGFPGHDWHYKVMTQYRAGIAAVRWLTPGAVEDSSSMWQDSMAAEGWGLYSESLPG